MFKSHLTPSTLSNESNFPSFLVDAYLLNALNSSSKDRNFIVHVESSIISNLFRNDSEFVTFSELNSYFRMLVHRVTRYYNLERNADGTKRIVTVWKPPSGHPRPLLKLADLVEPEANESPADICSNQATTAPPIKKFTIMKRDTGTMGSKSDIKRDVPKKTIEEREKEYEEARARIFDSLKEEPRVTMEDFDIEKVEEGPQNYRDDFDDEPEEIIHFQGWKNLDSIKPFVPEPSQPMPSSALTLSTDFDLNNIWIPQHIFIICGLPKREEEFKSLKSKLRRKFVKIYRNNKDNSEGLALFSYKVAQTDEEVGQLLGFTCHRWRPKYLPEPPV